MFRVLIADDNAEDRELLILEIRRALGTAEADLRFAEASSVRQALSRLTSQVFDLLTLDIEFDRLNEGIEVLPEIFDAHPALNIVIISGKLDKTEVSERLFRFTRDNVLKGKRWARHFDVLDKKDDKTEALRRAYSFAAQRQEGMDQLRDLFLLAESYLERNMVDKCIEVYQRIQRLSPGERESDENIRIVQGGISVAHAADYFRNGERAVAALVLGHALESRMKAYIATVLGRDIPLLANSLRELENNRSVGKKRLAILRQMYTLRNKAIHYPTTVTERDFDQALRYLETMEEGAA